MSHQCPFPVRSTNNRCCYRAGSVPGFALCLAVVAALSCYAGFSQAAQFAPARATVVSAAGPAIDAQAGPVVQD